MHENKLDSLIDQALITYAPESTTNLEDRIIANTRFTPTLVKETISAKWAGVMSGIAAAGIVAFVFLHNQSPQPLKDHAFSGSQESRSVARPVQPMVAARQQIIPVKHHQPSAHAKKPADSELITEQEQMLVELATQHPDQARQLVGINERDAEPLSIDPLTVRPIATEPLKIAALQIEPLR